jgi:hypothetical protein
MRQYGFPKKARRGSLFFWDSKFPGVKNQPG